MSENKKRTVKKIAGTVVTILLFAAAMMVLTHPAKNVRKTTELVPKIVDQPLYVECRKSEPLEITLYAEEDFTISGFQVLLVNLTEESAGTIHFSVTDAGSDQLMNQSIPVENIIVGSWMNIPGDVSFSAGENYQIRIVADGSEPYFMQVPREGAEALPYTTGIVNHGEAVDGDISLGVSVVEQKTVTYGDIFYHSVFLCVLLLVGVLCGIWMGKSRVCAILQKIREKGTGLVGRWGSDLFLLLLFGMLCINIYQNAYLKGVYISADSAGYLREAVNLVKGNGFGYDKLAGYDSWFANWPVAYPAMIAGTMLVTGTNAYLASKILNMLLIGVILLVLRCYFQKDAWVYALCLINPGFMELTWYAWSEVPFILFLLGFGLMLAGILQRESPGWKRYAGLCILGTGCFLIRYFGIYVWFAAGLYSLYYLAEYWRCREKHYAKKALGLIAAAGVSGCLSVGYLLMNRLMNGMASGVSRSMWWDDYEALTNDLIESLLTEIFNVFSLSIPGVVEEFPYRMKALVLLTVLAGLIWFIGKNCRRFTTESVLVVLSAVYDLTFIVIRYFSSMDTFYFRFFEPASFLLCIALIGLLLPYLRGKKGYHYFAGVVTVLTILSVFTMLEDESMEKDGSYYGLLTAQWENAYAEIPEKSVVIFDDIDFRSSWYRPDVVEGMITPADTVEALQNTYYGSDHLCIKAEFAEAMLESGEYETDVQKWLESGLASKAEDSSYIVLSLE